MKNEFRMMAIFNTNAETSYKAWISTQGHSSMTGSPAKVDGNINGAFTAWDGYIWGTFLELEENKKIIQGWRTSEFPEDAEDSIVEIVLEDKNSKVTLTLNHTNIPEGQSCGDRKW
jgi:activator of HSP90 ATPase